MKLPTIIIDFTCRFSDEPRRIHRLQREINRAVDAYFKPMIRGAVFHRLAHEGSPFRLFPSFKSPTTPNSKVHTKLFRQDEQITFFAPHFFCPSVLPTTPNTKEEIMPNDTPTDTAAAQPETSAIPADQRGRIDAATEILKVLAPFDSEEAYRILGIAKAIRVDII